MKAVLILLLLCCSSCYKQEIQRLYNEQIEPIKERQAAIAGEIVSRNPDSPAAVENAILSNWALEDKYEARGFDLGGFDSILALLAGIGGPVGGAAVALRSIVKHKKVVAEAGKLLQISDDEQRKAATIASKHVPTPKEFLS